MSIQNSYIPVGDSDKSFWLHNFAIKIPTYSAALNISSAEVQSVQHDDSMYAYIMNMSESIKQTSQLVTSYKSQLKHLSAGAAGIGSLPVMSGVGTAPPAGAGGG